MTTGLIIRSKSELDALEAQVVTSAKRTIEGMRVLLAETDPLFAFAAMKFEQTGFHPTVDRSLNLIEQINQTFTYLASVRATGWLMERYPKVEAFRLNLGTDGGTDVESTDANGNSRVESFPLRRGGISPGA